MNLLVSYYSKSVSEEAEIFFSFLKGERMEGQTVSKRKNTKQAPCPG